MGLIHIIAGDDGRRRVRALPATCASAFGESGIGWIPYALDRMDFEFEDRFRDLMKLKPSEYWRRQCQATFQFDPIGTKLIDDIGRRDPDVGLGLPAPRRRLAGIDEVHRRAVRRPAGRARSTRSPARTPPSSTGCELKSRRKPSPASRERVASAASRVRVLPRRDNPHPPVAARRVPPSPAMRERGPSLRATPFAKTSPDQLGMGVPGD